MVRIIRRLWSGVLVVLIPYSPVVWSGLCGRRYTWFFLSWSDGHLYVFFLSSGSGLGSRISLGHAVTPPDFAYNAAALWDAPLPFELFYHRFFPRCVDTRPIRLCVYMSRSQILDGYILSIGGVHLSRSSFLPILLNLLC